MFDEAWVEVAGGNLVRLPELSARLAVGEKGPVSAFAGSVSRGRLILLFFSGYPAPADVYRAGTLRFLAGHH